LIHNGRKSIQSKGETEKLHIKPKSRFEIGSMLIILLLLLCDVNSGCASKNNDKDTNDAYQFPAIPTNRDITLQGYYQVPKDILLNMSTEGLVQTVLDYPLLGNMFLRDSFQQGINAVVEDFNGISELFARKDAGSVLIHKYRTMNPNAFDHEWDSKKKAEFAVKPRWPLQNAPLVARSKCSTLGDSWS
jgi:hypothetical protein